MNTIYDGSFVLGNTNELTFSAGPGIRVDSPSEGTVRIANDETVLWSGTLTSASNIYNALSEPLSSFGFYRIHIRPNEQSIGMMEQIQDFAYNSGEQKWCYVDGRYIAANQRTQNTLYVEFNNSVDGFHLRPGWKMVGITQTTGVSNYDFTVTKVIGINRISGSNA